MTERLVLLGCLFAAFHLVAAAQGGGQPAPEPQNLGPPPVRLTGRVIADSTRQPDQIIEVRLESAGGARIAFAYTETAGAFDFRPVVLDPATFYYVVVELEGHLPFRERLDHLTNIRSGAPIVIFLEADEVEEVSAPASDEPVVDVQQLGAVIPDEAISEYEAAMADAGQRAYPSAILRLERAVELAPDFFEALTSLGGQYVRAGRYREAESVLERALELSPASTVPLMNLGVLHYQEGQSLRGSDDEAAEVSFSRSVDELARAVRNLPLDATAHYYLGAALYETGDFDRAEVMLNLAIELDSAPEEARLVLVNLFSRQGRFEEALEHVTAYLERNPSSPMRPSLEELRSQIESRIETGQ